jgi:uncharacterized protein
MPNPPPAASQPCIQWQPWSAAPFQRSAAEQRPVLLFVTTSWSTGSAAMLRTSYADPRVAACVEARYVPVHVDAECRPDVAERYALDGWPATLLLTADGEILYGATYLEPAALHALLERTAVAHRARSAEIATRAAAASAARRDDCETLGPTRPALELAAEIAAALLERTDRRAGGFSGKPKRLHADALRFLLRYGVAAGDGEAIAHVEQTLDAVDDSPLAGRDGELFRCALGDDWSEASTECDAGTQAGGLRVFAEAHAALGHARYGARARALAEHARVLWRPSSSGHADGRPPACRATDLLAELVSAGLCAAAVLSDRALAREALSTLERVSLATYRPGHGVTHADEPGSPQLLADHVQLIAALLEAQTVTGDLPYAMLAEELGWFVVSSFAGPARGPLRDRVHASDDVGRLAEPWHPFRANALAAAVLARLAAASGEAAFDEVAAGALAWAAARWRAQDLDAAACGLAALDLIDCRPHS